MNRTPRLAPWLVMPRSRTLIRAAALTVAASLVTAACSDDSADTGDTTATADAPTDDAATTSTAGASTTTAEASTTSTGPPPPVRPVPTPTVDGPIAGAPVQPQPAVPPPAGYVEEEFFVSGTAASFVDGSEPDGTAVPDDTADFTTRVLVRRPPVDRFSGTVIVEWLNVTAVEASPDWGYLSEEVGRSGHAYVVVSAQALGVEGGESLLEVSVDEQEADELGEDPDSVNDTGLVNVDPDRYGSLSHPGDAYAYDIFSQVGTAVAAGEGGLLGDLAPTTVIAVGESQSAGFLTTYLNQVHPVGSVYDAILVHSRGAGGAPLGGDFGSQVEAEAESFTDDDVTIRDDLDVPVLILQAETDLTLLGYHAARQPDSDLIRTWEMAGTAHSDAHVFRAFVGGPRDASVGSLIGCTDPINTGPHHEIAQAALSHLIRWAEGGPPPPTAEPLALVDGEPVAIERDELGMAVGGVRNPLVDVPVAVVTGDPWGAAALTVEEFDVCDLFGQTIALDQATLVGLHGSAAAYVEAFSESAEAAVAAGFLLPADAEQLVTEAEANRALFG